MPYKYLFHCIGFNFYYVLFMYFFSKFFELQLVESVDTDSTNGYREPMDTESTVLYCILYTLNYSNIL